MPSRFVQTETFINPNNATSGSHSFHPPFNRIYHYREPGRINLNTIYSQDVFNGLMNYFPGTTDGNAVEQVRAQPPRPTQCQRPIRPVCDAQQRQRPTRFANPFRSFAGGDLSTFSTPRRRREIEATVLRSDPDNPGVRPLFQIDTSGDAAGGAPVPRPAHRPGPQPVLPLPGACRGWATSSPRARTSTPSGSPSGIFRSRRTKAPARDARHPDGYQLGPELGSDTGEIERHRAFYIFDRTIPVGFVRGQDLNVEKALLLRRYIE